MYPTLKLGIVYFSMQHLAPANTALAILYPGPEVIQYLSSMPHSHPGLALVCLFRTCLLRPGVNALHVCDVSTLANSVSFDFIDCDALAVMDWKSAQWYFCRSPRHEDTAGTRACRMQR